MPHLNDEQLKVLLAHRLPALLKNATPEQRLAYAQEVAGQDLDLGTYQDYVEDDPLQPENQQDVGQEQDNPLDLENIDQSGLKREGDNTSWDKSAAKQGDTPKE